MDAISLWATEKKDYIGIPPGVDVRPKFHWGFSWVVVCSGYVQFVLGFAQSWFRTDRMDPGPHS